jgi:hypothetical protein
MLPGAENLISTTRRQRDDCATLSGRGPVPPTAGAEFLLSGMAGLPNRLVVFGVGI